MKPVIIVDTNIIFSILRVGKSKAREIIFEHEHLQFYAPNFLSVEIFKHKERILVKGKIQEDEVYELLQSLFDKIHFVNETLVSIENIMYAYRLCKDVDEKDIPFVALCLELDALLWTKDEKLKTHLQSKGFDSFFEI
jgi:predicted nucleic acid-binding protein